MGSMGYSQLRGFLYILFAGAYANLCKADKILVTECGPTMYQPLFSPYDSITYTTHPYVLKAAKDVLDLLLDSKPKIIIPFEDLTKAEVISNSGITDYSKKEDIGKQMHLLAMYLLTTCIQTIPRIVLFSYRKSCAFNTVCQPIKLLKIIPFSEF